MESNIIYDLGAWYSNEDLTKMIYHIKNIPGITKCIVFQQSHRWPDYYKALHIYYDSPIHMMFVIKIGEVIGRVTQQSKFKFDE